PPQGLLNAARALYPANPHLDVAQQVIVMKPPVMQPHVLPPLTQPVLRPPGDRPAPLTLNEISHTTSTRPVRLGNHPSGTVAAVSPSAPSRIPAVGQQAPAPASHSLRSLQQFLQPPGAFTPPHTPPATRHAPPAVQQHLPSMLAPRGTYHLPP